MPEITIYPSDDSMVRSAYPDTCFGASALLDLQNVSGVYRYSYLKFATTSIPAGVNILSAIFYIYVYTAIEGFNDIQTFLVDSVWAEGTITYNTRPTVTGSNLHTFDFTSDGYKNSGLDLKETFNSWYKETISNYGLRLSVDTPKTGIPVAHSKEQTGTSKDPYFLVNYYRPSGFLLFM